MKKCLFSIAVLIAQFSFNGPALADFEDGLKAYKQGDFHTAISEWESEAEKGNPAAQFNLGNMLFHGHGTIKNESLAQEYYTKAAELDFPPAQHILGLAFSEGKLGRTTNYEKAREFFLAASEQGYTKSQEILAFFLFQGAGGPKDVVQSFMWNRIAFDNGSLLARKQMSVYGSEMTDKQIADALERVLHWKPRPNKYTSKLFSGVETPF